MAEPLHTMWRKGCVIILAVLRSISSGLSRKNSLSIIILFKKVTPKFSRSIESYLVYMVWDDL
jgi:6-phosphogluconate dehydrogenase